MSDIQEARELAWNLAWQYRYDWERSSVSDCYTPDRNYLRAANALRDMCDAVEFWKNDSMESGRLYQDLGQVMGDACDEKDGEIKKLTEQRDTFAQDNINLRGGFYGPRAEIESHMQAEIDRLTRKLLDNNIPVE